MDWGKKIEIMKYLIVALSLLISQCGFSPMYKVDSASIGLDQLSIKFEGNVTYEIKEELERLIGTDNSNNNYTISIEVKEDLIPVIVNENGTVSKYQIDIALFFKVIDKFNKIILEGVSIGFSQYDVLVSEIDNENIRKQMLKSATNDAASLMITKIQSKLSLTNDY